jgi:hypothetical protein
MMTSTTPSITSSIIAYTGYFILMAIIINIMLAALIIYAGMDPDSAKSMGWIPLVTGAMMAGQRYGKLAGVKPLPEYAWLAALGFTAISLAAIALGWYATGLMAQVNVGGRIAYFMNELGSSKLGLAVVVLFFLFIWALLRFSFSFGAGQSIAQAAKKDFKTKT